MKQWKHKKAVPYIALGSLTVFFCWLFVLRYGIFGSKVDWISQHSVFPNYFRQQFYETGQFFPEFAANIGGGQNIYHFSYYGLYNPIILFSYLLPFVKMEDYMMAAGIVGIAVSVMLFYKWLLKKGISERISFLTALCFLLAGPMIFQSYSQIMFVNYMPFLCMALFGVDAYFEKKKKRLYAGSVCLMILTSFYFSIGGMLMLVVYGIYCYLQQAERTDTKVKVTTFLIDGIKFLMPMLTAVLMSGVLLVPTAMALSGKRGAGAAVDWKSLFLPDFSVFRFVYTAYGIGLTTIIISVLTAGIFYRKQSERVLHLSCILVMTVPLFAYLLNGGLYIRDKVWIPFLPLLCYILAGYWEKQRKQEIAFGIGILPFGLTILWVCLTGGQQKYWKLVLIDAIVMLLCLVWFYWKQDVQLLILVPIFFLVLYGGVAHKGGNQVVDNGFYQKVTDSDIQNAVKEITNREDGFFRIEQMGTDQENAANLNRIWDMGQYSSSLYSSAYDAAYQEFRKDTFLLEQPYRNFLMQPSVQNPVFQKLMGTKYFLSEKEVPGYDWYKTVGKVNIYKNNKALSIAYVTDQVMSEETYRDLKYPYNQMAFLNSAIVKDTDSKAASEKMVTEVMLPKKHIEINEKHEKVVKLPLPQVQENDIFFLTMKVQNHQPEKDVAVWLEGTRNKLTSREHIYYNGNTEFHYAIRLKKDQKTVELRCGAGDYELCDIQAWIGKDDADTLCRSVFQLEKQRTRGNQIAGRVSCRKDGYLITSIPYDEAFEVRVDGKKAEYEKVNTAFLGMKMKKGNHEIEMIYHAPGVRSGKILSLMGGLLFFLL